MFARPLKQGALAANDKFGHSWTMTLAAPERRKRKGYPPRIRIEVFPAFAFRDPSDDVERCQHAYRRVVGRAADNKVSSIAVRTSSSIHETNDTVPERF